MERNLEKKNLRLALLSALIPTLFFSTLLPNLRLMFFSPFLIILYYQKSFLTSLWSAFLCGFLLDILSSDAHLGLHAISYSAATWLLYNQRRNFFADSLSTLPLMTYFFSCLASALQFLLMYIFEQGIPLSWGWALTDLVYMPAFDAFYAFFYYIFPAIFFGRRPRRGRDYFHA